MMEEEIYDEEIKLIQKKKIRTLFINFLKKLKKNYLNFECWYQKK